MKRCEQCHSTDLGTEVVQEVFNIDGKLVLIEGIPATVCSRCGEEMFSRATTETVRRLVHGESEPSRSVSVDVFSYPPEAA